MTTALLLEALRKHNLHQYYPSLVQKKIVSIDYISQMSAADFLKLGITSSEDRTKFMDLSRDMKAMIQSRESKYKTQSGCSSSNTNNGSGSNANNISGSNTTNRSSPSRNTNRIIKSSGGNNIRTSPVRTNNTIVIPVLNKTDLARTEPIPSRKRPSSAAKASPERKARRMTIAPQTVIPRSPPAKTSARDRRLSYLPRRDSFYRSPTNTTTSPKVTSPYRPKPDPIKKPKIAESFTIVEPPKEPLIERPSARLLDVYGIPITARQQPQPKKPSENSLTNNLEECVSKSKTKATVASSLIPDIATTSVSVLNGEFQQRIRVCVRKRPLNKKELQMQETDIAPVVGARTIELNAPKTRIDLSRYAEKHIFTFHDTFDSNITNTEIYTRTAQPLVDYIFSGGKATCFAFGQTGSGKTFTMLNPSEGLYILAAQDIFRMLMKPNYTHLTASVGFYEIYQGHLYDLLNQKLKLTAREDGNGNVVIAGLREYQIADVQDLMTVLEYGNQERTTGKTGANNKSSRSHAVLQVLLKTKDSVPKVYSKLSFIDLAGSERGADRGDANTKTRLEGAEINKSLLALKECIRAVDNNKKHTPFRGSKLTQVLRDSFTGDSRTCMIATISPNYSNSEHTLNTLRYADRVKEFRGESDPRISAEYRSNKQTTLVDNDDGVDGDNRVSGDFDNLDADIQEPILVDADDDDMDIKSIASYGDDNHETLFDVDFPTEVTTEALATPTNTRFWTVEDRQEHLMRRLESPPAEVFSSNVIMEDPFFSKPLQKSSHNTQVGMDSTMKIFGKSRQETPIVDVGRIREFLKLHRAQIRENDDCLREEKKIIARMALTISSHQDFRSEYDADNEEDQKSKEEFETYLNDLEEILERKVGYVDFVRNKIKEELEDDNQYEL